MKKNTLPTNPCANCNSPLTLTPAYCSNCGQKVAEQLTVGVLFYNTISNYFSFDARFFKSLLPLLFKPGHVAKAFVSGKRMQYLHPAQCYLFVSVVFFFLFSFDVRQMDRDMNREIKNNFDQLTLQKSNARRQVKQGATRRTSATVENAPIHLGQDLSEQSEWTSEQSSSTNGLQINFDPRLMILDSLVAVNAPLDDQLAALEIDQSSPWIERIFAEQYLKFHVNRGGGILQSFFDTIPIALFFFLPVFSLLLHWIYRKKSPFAHHLVFGFYFFSFLFLLLSIFLVWNRLFVINSMYSKGVVAVLIFVYLWKSSQRFYEETAKKSFIKTIAVMGINTLFILPFALVVILVASFLFY